MRNTLCTLLLITTALAQAQNYGIQTTFGNNGWFDGDMGPGDDHMRTSVLQPDGKLIIAGTGYDINANSFHVSMVRIDTVCGTLDPSFGTGGELTLIFEQRTQLNAVALQPDGKIIGCGMIAPSNGFASQWPGVFRLHTDGSVDSTFNSTGYLRVEAPGGGSGNFSGIFVTDTTITLSGASANGGLLWLRRYLYDGSVDTSFANNGEASLSLPNWGLFYENMGIQLTDSSYVTGMTWASPNDYAFGLVKFLPNGDPDSTFGVNGVAATLINGRSDGAMGLAELADGKLLMSGKSNGSSGSGLVMVRLLPNGTPDPTFGTDGVSRVSGLDGGDYGSAFVVLPYGGTLQFAKAAVGNGGALMRDADGSVVSSFGTNGFLEIAGYAMTAGILLPSERMVCYGFSASTVGYAIAGLTSDPVGDGLPVIAQNGAGLVVNGPGEFQWFLDGQLINGATSSAFTPAQNGEYTVTMTVSPECIFTSSPYTVLNVGISDLSGTSLHIANNPVTDILVVLNNSGVVRYELLSIEGQRISTGLLHGGRNEIDMNGMASGVYLLRTGSVGEISPQRIIKQ